MRWFIDFCYLIAAGLLVPVVFYRAITTGKYRSDWMQRFGGAPQLQHHPSRVWIHAVSVGEVNAVRGLVEAWRKRSPETEIVLSVTTDTGIARARQLFGDLTIFRYPLDISLFVNRALNRIKPTMIVLVELEVWYQFVTLAAARRIPVAVVNGRLSETSLRRFGWIRPVADRMFKALAWVGAQDETYADRFRRVGVATERVSVAGSMKWDTAELVDQIPGNKELAKAMGLDPSRPTWVCGSTGPGEEAIILKARDRIRQKYPNLQVVLVPRKPERFDEVASAIRKAGLSCVRRSESPNGSERKPTEGMVLLGDTMGELRKFYTLANVVFVGRTLAAMGGSDMMEVAALARPIIVGKHTENFADTVEQLKRGQAIRIVDADLDTHDVADQLAQAVIDLLNDRQAANTLADNGREVVKQNRGAIERTLLSLMETMQRAQHHSS